MKDVKLSFTLNRIPCCAICRKGDREALKIDVLDGVISCDVAYDHSDRPLRLSAQSQLGDAIEIIMMPHRIELYVGGELADEEWPRGNRLYELGDAIYSAICEVKAEEYHAVSTDRPAVISTFENAEGWCPGGGVFVGDCMPYRRGDEYHVLYLKDRHHHSSKWGFGAHQWEHISTEDFKTWRIHPMAVPITDPIEGSICTGSWIGRGNTEYLYYTVRIGGGVPAPVRRSISYDGYHFEKDASFGFTLSERYGRGSARDPKVIFGDDGLFHMLLTTSLAAEGRGCLAHYVSSDLESWEDYGEPIYVAPAEDQPECPDYFKYNGRYYLVFSLRGKARYMVSDKPFEGFVMPEDPIIPCASVPKCAEWKGRLVFAGFCSIGGYAGTMTFKAARADENGLLIFEDL